MIIKPNINFTPICFQKPSIQLIPNQVLRPVRSAESLLQQPQENVNADATASSASSSAVKTRSPNRAQAQKKAARKVRAAKKRRTIGCVNSRQPILALAAGSELTQP